MYFDSAVLLWAVILDYIFADPRCLPHPVVFLGKIATFLEHKLLAFGQHYQHKKYFLSGYALRRAGLAGLVLLCAFSAGVVYSSITLLNYWAGAKFSFWLELYFAWSGLALGGLLLEGKASLNIFKKLDSIEKATPLWEQTLAEARQAVAMLVSRDTAKMQPLDLRRSLAESLSENFCDAFIAPLFWLCVAGPVGLWGYKATSTLDSMWGYKTEKWKDFGFAAAKFDDLLAYLPARLSAVFIFLVMRLLRRFDLKRQTPLWSQIVKEAKSMESPNAGWSMSAAAWAVDARMGGATPYAGVLKAKPILGPELEPDWTCAKLTKLLRLLQYSAGLAVVALIIIKILLFLVF